MATGPGRESRAQASSPGLGAGVHLRCGGARGEEAPAASGSALGHLSNEGEVVGMAAGVAEPPGTCLRLQFAPSWRKQLPLPE